MKYTTSKVEYDNRVRVKKNAAQFIFDPGKPFVVGSKKQNLLWTTNSIGDDNDSTASIVSTNETDIFPLDHNRGWYHRKLKS